MQFWRSLFLQLSVSLASLWLLIYFIYLSSYLCWSCILLLYTDTVPWAAFRDVVLDSISSLLKVGNTRLQAGVFRDLKWKMFHSFSDPLHCHPNPGCQGLNLQMLLLFSNGRKWFEAKTHFLIGCYVLMKRPDVGSSTGQVFLCSLLRDKVWFYAPCIWNSFNTALIYLKPTF